jgi:hypothetical protein
MDIALTIFSMSRPKRWEFCAAMRFTSSDFIMDRLALDHYEVAELDARRL